MTRIKKFGASIDVSNEFLRAAPDVRKLAENSLIKKLSGELRGPRGGRYVPVGEVTLIGEDKSRYFYRDVTTFAAVRMGRYVRPGR